MEFWILLAAAGSGYLAHRWQNQHKSKGAFSDACDDDGSHSGSSWSTPSSAGRYYHLASSNRRFKGSSYSNQCVSKLSDCVGNMTVAYAPCLSNSTGDLGVMDKAEASQYAVITDTCSCSNISMHPQTGLDAVGSCLTNKKNSIVSPPRCPASHTCNAFYECNRCVFDSSHQSFEGHERMSAEAILGNQFSSYLTGAFVRDGSDSILCAELPLKLLCDEEDDDIASEEEAFSYDEKLVLGYLKASQDTLHTSTSLMVQDHDGRSSDIRQRRSHRKNCRSRRCRNLESHSPSISSESCFSAQLDDVSSNEGGGSDILSSSTCERSFNGLEEQSADAIVSDSLLTEELLSASRYEAIKMSNKIHNFVYGEEAAGSAHWPCLPPRSKSREQVKTPTGSPASSGGDCFILQGTDSLMKTLLFNFGVGVGMMFAILSKNHGSKQSIGPLEVALCSLEELEAEVHGLMFECYQTKNAREDALPEQIIELFDIVMRILDAVKQIRESFPQDLACISAMDLKDLRDRGKLEAELEAELAKMEVALSIGDLGQRFSNGIEDDLIIGNTIRGGLSTRALPRDDESTAEIGSGADACYEIIRPGNFAVSAVELAVRLYELSDAQQEREILELEAEVRHLDGRLQAKEEELQVWKQRVWQLLQGGFGESFPSFQEDVGAEALETAQMLRSTAAPCHRSIGNRRLAFGPSLSSCYNEHMSNTSSKEAFSLHRRAPEPTSSVTRDTDDEVLGQFFSSTETESPSSPPKCLFRSSHAKDNGNKGMAMSHEELESTGFLYDAADDTSDNSPYSVKFVDKHTILHHNLEDKRDHKEDSTEALTGKNFAPSDRIEEVVPTHKAIISSSRQKLPDVIEISENYAESRHTSGWSTSEDSSYSSDLDEKLGRILIERIVKKSKRGSLIVEAAQSAMASFDNN